MTALNDVLQNLGVDVHRQSGDEIQGRCPVHHLYKGRSSQRNSWYINVDTGLWHCFTCGARGNLPHLVTSLTQDPSAIKDVHLYMAQAGIDQFNSSEEDEEPEVVADWSIYASFDRVPNLLLESRGLDANQAVRYGLRFNKAQQYLPDGKTVRPDYKCWITPVMDPFGNLKGWQAKQKGYFVNIPTGLHKSESLFGFHFARQGSTALLVESPLDVVRFHSVYEGDEIQCISSYGASVSDFQIGLIRGKFDKLIMAMDDDDAGRLEADRLSGKTKRSTTNLLTGFRKRVWWWSYSDTGAKDIGDMTDAQILEGIDSIGRVRT